ncbi:MAG TPA: CAP domain-containing protein [Isosphaeraceae bacterium]|nr:CAP domain-containing protein [Isosphaeraceae bacterium]
MSRPSFRRTMTLESLERREVLSAAPTAAAQQALSLMNLARTNPQAAANWLSHEVANDPNVQATLSYYGVNLQQKLSQLSSATAQPPLAWNDALGNAAQGHSQDMSSNNFQSHTGSDGSSPSDRISNAGYGAASSEGEDAFAYASSVKNSVEAFLLDWGVSDDGHYKNIMQPGTSAQDAYSDAGIGLISSSDSAGNPLSVVTVDFAKGQNSQPQLVGVVYNDSNGNNVYDPGEGQGGVVIKATNLASGQVSSTTSADPGGYQMPLAAGSYDVEAIGSNGQTLSSQDVTIGSTNAEADFNLLSPSSASSQYTAPAPVVRAAVQVSAPQVSAPIAQAVIQAPTPTPAAPAPVNPLSFITSWTAYKANVQS